MAKSACNENVSGINNATPIVAVRPGVAPNIKPTITPNRISASPIGSVSTSASAGKRFVTASITKGSRAEI